MWQPAEITTVVVVGTALASATTPEWNGSSTPEAIRTGRLLNLAARRITSLARNDAADEKAPRLAVRACS